MSLFDLSRRGLLACTLVIAACGAAHAQAVLNRGLDGDPTTLDPHKTSTVTDAHVLRDLYEGLMIHDARGRVTYGAAESHTRSADGRVYTFRIRPTARWSNGDPVRAQDFVFSIRRVANPATAAQYASILYPILNVERVNRNQGANLDDIGARAVDERTLEITLERPVPYFLELLTHQTALPVHPPTVTQHGEAFIRPGNTAYNGAYTLVEQVPGSHIRMRRNPNFHDAANVAIETVNHIPLRDLAASTRRFIAGEIHLTVDIPADQLRQLRQQLGNQVSVAPLLGTHYFSFNTTKAPFNDRRVRQALSMVIDREFIADQIWQGTALPAYSFVPPGTNNFVGEVPVPAWAALSAIDREARARELLAAAGFNERNPLRLQIRFNMTENNRATMVAVADMWRQIGVETTMINTDARTHFNYLRERGDYDVARAGWVGDFNDPQNFLFLLESTNTLNYARWTHAPFDALMRSAEGEGDLERRAQILANAERMIQEEVPYAALLYFTNRNLVSPRLRGFSPNPRGAFATRFMSLAN